jgi:argininosuccinate lyase
MRVNRAACERAAAGGYSNATELADYLVGRGIAFRDAHHFTGQMVRRAIEVGVALEGLELAEMQRICPAVEGEVFRALTLSASVGRRNVLGGTGPGVVEKAVAVARARVDGV